MIAVAKNETSFVEMFSREKASFAGAPWVSQLRETAIETFGTLGMPTRRDEEWRYMDLRPLAGVDFKSIPAPGVLDPKTLKAHTISDDFYQLVFVDGHCNVELSRVADLPKGVELLSVSEAVQKTDSPFKQTLLQSSLFKSHAFAALNTAFLDDGVALYLGAGVQLDKPLQLLFISTEASDLGASHPRHLIHLGEKARAEIVETYVSDASPKNIVNVVAEVSLEKGAHLVHHRVQAEATSSTHLYLATVNVREDARYESNVFLLGGGASRNEMEAHLQGKNAFCSLNGVYVGSGTQCLDNRTLIDHQTPDGTSRQFYKGVLGGSSRGVFNGKVLVRQDAQRTDAEQNNRNLLLSDDAEADAKPQLEIYADDVKCSHGATVGQLDEDAIFYLRTRGIGEKAARDMLTTAFAVDLVEAIPNHDTREFIEKRIASKLREEMR